MRTGNIYRIELAEINGKKIALEKKILDSALKLADKYPDTIIGKINYGSHDFKDMTPKLFIFQRGTSLSMDEALYLINAIELTIHPTEL